jgi:hypothetical protein
MDNRRMTQLLKAIMWGGGACGILDGFAASVQFALKGIGLLRVWQGVASGLIGERAFGMGWRSGGFGLILHFLIAAIITTVFVGVSPEVPALQKFYWISGPLYGVIVFLVMNLIVVPLSARPKRPAPLIVIAVQIVIHMFFVGLPIAMAANRFLSPE